MAKSRNVEPETPKPYSAGDDGTTEKTKGLVLEAFEDSVRKVSAQIPADLTKPTQ